MGPIGQMPLALGAVTYRDAVEQFADQARALADGGIDLLSIESMSDLAEILAAIEGARRVIDLPIFATMSFDTQGKTLTGITPTADGGLRIGALTRHAELATSSVVIDRAPLLAAAARHVGHAVIRNQGTLGGSLAHADPAAELPAALVALDARVQMTGPRGARAVAAGA